MRKIRMACVWLCLLTALIVTLTTLVRSEEPALEQCRADGMAWQKIDLAIEDASQKISQGPLGSDLNKLDAARNYWRRFPASEISRHDEEMESCYKLDPQNGKTYLFDDVYLEAEENNRYFHFLLSHKLWNEFVADDAEGKR
jgi:hypothetical protein